jgi:hypothetical protein
MWRRFLGGLQDAVAAARELGRREVVLPNQRRIVRTGAGVAACAVAAGMVVGLTGSPAPQRIPAVVEQKSPTPPRKTGVVDKEQARRLNAMLRRFELRRRADEESAEAVRRETARLESFFAECKKGARPFADEVLSTEASLRLAGSAAENSVNALGEWFGGAASRGPDSFDRYVTECFERHVLKAADVQRAVEAAFNGYSAELARIESRLLVDLRADPDAGDIGQPVKLLPWNTDNFLAASLPRVIEYAVAAVRKDLCVSIGKFGASWVGGDMVEKRITNKDDHALKRFGVNVAAGMAIDKVLDEGLARAGYDPAGSIAADACLKLDAICDLVLEGTTASSIGPGGHRKALVVEIAKRMAWQESGLRTRLMAVHSLRSRERSKALFPNMVDFVRPAPPTPKATAGEQ